MRGEDVSAAAEAGDPAAQQVIREVGFWVGFGLANLACVTDPECFVLGGGLVHAGDLLLNRPAAPSPISSRAGGRRPAVQIVPAAFGERAGAVGAALGARQGGSGDPGRCGPAHLPRQPDAAFAAAEEAVAAGIDGLFCYDHLWPMGQPERPALAPFPLLGALAARFGPSGDGTGDGPFFGTLVARIGLVPGPVLAAEFGRCPAWPPAGSSPAWAPATA